MKKKLNIYEVNKKKVIKIYNKYKKLFIKYYYIFLKLLKKDLIKIKEYLLCEKNRKRNLITVSLLIVINLLALLFTSFAYYENNDFLVLLHTYVGDFQSAKYDNVLKIYLEDGIGSNTYHLASNIPTVGYTYSRASCENNSEITYDDVNKVTTVITDTKDICSIYFNLNNNLDVVVNINIEKDINSNDYIISKNIPYYGYTYNNYSCNNNSTLNYDGNSHSISVNTLGGDSCNIYFTKDDTDITTKLYIETGLNSNKYREEKSIPSIINYTLNSEKSSCTNNEEITYENGYINISSNSASDCTIYLDVSNE